jgi:uncharacterized protein
MVLASLVASVRGHRCHAQCPHVAAVVLEACCIVGACAHIDSRIDVVWHAPYHLHEEENVSHAFAWCVGARRHAKARVCSAGMHSALRRKNAVKVRVWVHKSRIAGLGLFAAQDIKQGTRILPYIGEKIPKDESTRRLAQGNVYIFTFNDRYDIDGKILRNTARYSNHSCDPNCEVEKTTRTIWIVALRDIRAGEELTYNYGYEYDPDSYHDFPCRCGAKQCCGYILARRYWGLLPKSARASRG